MMELAVIKVGFLTLFLTLGLEKHKQMMV